jgi:FAD/FMN-containing dehydrogenase
MTTIDRPAGTDSALDDAALGVLRGGVTGQVIVPSDAGYDDARRVWNGNVDRRPAVVVRCSGVADVQFAVGFAREHALLVSVRGGGHSAPGYGTNDGGIVIDL